MSAQHYNLSSYAKLWRLNRQLKKKNRITAFRKMCTAEPAASI